MLIIIIITNYEIREHSSKIRQTCQTADGSISTAELILGLLTNSHRATTVPYSKSVSNQK